MTSSEPSHREAVDRIEMPYRVRFDESTPANSVRSSVLLRYVQDVAWVHSVRLGFGRSWYAERGLGWLVRVADLELLEPIEAYAELFVSTQVIGWRRVSARRESGIRDAAGRIYARALIDWVLANERGMPTRVPAELSDLFPTASPSFEPNRVLLPPTPSSAVIWESSVRPHELDPMGHVNNTVYLDYLEEAVAAAGGDANLVALPRRYRLEYLRPAAPGARLTGAAWHDQEDWAYRLTDGSGAELLRATLHVGEPG